MADLSAHGLAVSTPPGWEGRIFRRLHAGQVAAASGDVGPPAPAGEETYPVVHAATIPLSSGVADYASDAVEHLGPGDAIIVIKEFAPRNATQAVFASSALPRSLDPDFFAPDMLQRRLSGQAGLQRFGSEGGRAFCLYVVLGSYQNRHQVVPSVNAVLGSLRIDPLPGP
jgi:hypothetical protein